MAKLTQKKINWIIKQKEDRVSSSEIARIMNITPRYVNMIYRKYRLEGMWNWRIQEGKRIQYWGNEKIKRREGFIMKNKGYKKEIISGYHRIEA